MACGYLEQEAGERLRDEYEQLIRMIVSMIIHPEKWTIAHEK
jgi:hypothetical protein